MSAAAVGEPAAPAAADAPRWLGLDALRGAAIAAMILVNNPGDWGHVYAPLQHAAWHGCTFTDLVFPTFLFVVGVAIVPALGGALQRGRSARELRPRILRRALSLVLLGLFVQAFPLVTFADGRSLFAPLLEVRWPGVLQRIGVCYGLAALLFVGASVRVQRWTLLGCLLVYWPLLALCPTPDGGPPDLASQGDHLAGWLDRAVFGQHLYRARDGGVYDPEGLLSTIPALATTLLGVAAGRVLAGVGPLSAKVKALLLRGAAWTAAGAAFGWVFPINKALWTSSYALFTAGIAASGLGLLVHVCEERGQTAWTRPLVVYGRNALLVFVGSGILARTISRLVHVGGGPDAPSLQRWLYQHLLASWASPHAASLAWALLWVTGWYAVLAVLYRRNIVWKV